MIRYKVSVVRAVTCCMIYNAGKVALYTQQTYQIKSDLLAAKPKYKITQT